MSSLYNVVASLGVVNIDERRQSTYIDVRMPKQQFNEAKISSKVRDSPVQHVRLVVVGDAHIRLCSSHDGFFEALELSKFNVLKQIGIHVALDTIELQWLLQQW